MTRRLKIFLEGLKISLPFFAFEFHHVVAQNVELLPALREVVDGDVMRGADVKTYSRLLRIEVVRVANVNKHQVLKDYATEK